MLNMLLLFYNELRMIYLNFTFILIRKEKIVYLDLGTKIV